MDPTTSNNALNPNNNIVRNWLIGIGIALIIIIAITFAIHRKDTLSPVIGGDMSTTTGEDTDMAAGTASSTSTMAGTDMNMHMNMPAGATTPATGEMLTVDNQAAGGSVTIASMTLTGKSWVAVKNDTGVILGAGLFQTSDTKGMISLIKGTIPGQTYEVVIYVDNSGKAFDYKQDALVVGADNAPVSATFTAQ